MVTCSRDGIGLKRIASGAVSGLNAFVYAGRFGSNGPVAEVVTACVCKVGFIGIAASRTGVNRVTAFGAGSRNSPGSGVVVTGCRDGGVVKRGAALRAGVFRVSRFGAGSSDNFLDVLVAGSIERLGDKTISAFRADFGDRSVLGAGRFDDNFVKVVAGSLNRGVNDDVAASRTGVSRISCLFTSGFGDNVNVTMTACGNRIVNESVAADRAGIRCVTVRSTCRFGHDRSVSVYVLEDGDGSGNHVDVYVIFVVIAQVA